MIAAATLFAMISLFSQRYLRVSDDAQHADVMPAFFFLP